MRYRLVDLASPHKPYRYRHGWIPVNGTIPKMKQVNPFYNTVPEMRGISRTKSTYEEGGSTGRSREDAERLAAFRASQVKPLKRSDFSNPDTPRSREVTEEEFRRVEKRGAAKYAALTAAGSEPKALEGDSWEKIKAHAFEKSREPWGGVTIDAHSGEEVRADADAYAVTVRPRGVEPVTVSPTASRGEFDKAMDEARRRFADVLRRKDHHLGVFHDQDTGRIDIDPVLVTARLEDAEDIGAHTRAVGGAYHFKSGDGYWPPHVKGK